MDEPGFDDLDYEQDGRRATVRYTPEDAEWNVFAPSGVYVATFVRNGSAQVEGGAAPLYELVTNRTAPRSAEADHVSTDWRGLIDRALIEFEGFEGVDDLLGE